KARTHASVTSLIRASFCSGVRPSMRPMFKIGMVSPVKIRLIITDPTRQMPPRRTPVGELRYDARLGDFSLNTVCGHLVCDCVAGGSLPVISAASLAAPLSLQPSVGGVLLLMDVLRGGGLRSTLWHRLFAD